MRTDLSEPLMVVHALLFGISFHGSYLHDHPSSLVIAYAAHCFGGMITLCFVKFVKIRHSRLED